MHSTCKANAITGLDIVIVPSTVQYCPGVLVFYVLVVVRTDVDHAISPHGNEEEWWSCTARNLAQTSHGSPPREERKCIIVSIE
jgi:hypothetical protein